MLLSILFGISIIGYFWYQKSKRNQTNNKKEMQPINLDDPAQIRFVKTERWNQYQLEFFNPLYNDWWVLPALDAGIHKPWSFEQKGSYGPYDIYTFRVESGRVESYKSTFRTLRDVENYMVQLRKKCTDFQESKRRDNDLPKVIY